jgi:hypothetical protein
MNLFTENLLLHASAVLPDERGVFQFLARNKTGPCFYITALKAHDEVSHETFKEALNDVYLEYVTNGTILPGTGVGSKRALIPLTSGDVSGFTTKDVHGFISQAPRSILESHRAFNILAMMP